MNERLGSNRVNSGSSFVHQLLLNSETKFCTEAFVGRTEAVVTISLCLCFRHMLDDTDRLNGFDIDGMIEHKN